MRIVEPNIIERVHPARVSDGARGVPALVARYAEIRRAGSMVLASGSLHLPAGSCTGLVGVNGSGKSSLLLTVAGLLRGRPIRWQAIARRGTAAGGESPGPGAPDAGTPDVGTPDAGVPDAGTPEVGVPEAGAHDPNAHEPNARDAGAPTVGYVPQHPTFPRGIGLDALLAAHRLRRADIAAIDPGCLPSGRDAQRDAARLSGGQRQRLAFAIALARRDPLVLLDEPFANVDIPTRRVLVEAIRARRAAQPEVAMLLSSHAAVDLHLLCDRLIILRDGAQHFQGTVASLTGLPHAAADEFEEAVTRSLLSPPPDRSDSG